MSNDSEKAIIESPNPQKLPAGLTHKEKAFPTIFIDTGVLDLKDPAAQEKINTALAKACEMAHPHKIDGQVLAKVHIGEAKNVTRMKPLFMRGLAQYAKKQGASGIAAGDTTVAYSGARGHHQNIGANFSSYMDLARKNGWTADGEATIPFVIIDRPASSVPGVFEFDAEEERRHVKGLNLYREADLPGGFAAADFLINNAHLTMHMQAGVAGVIKSIAMGCATVRGKVRMHQNLHPVFDADKCVACGLCVERCPEKALNLEGRDVPEVDENLCIGCGECAEVCPQSAVTIVGENIKAWERGEDSMPVRLSDYTMGLMAGKWDSSIHVLHAYTVTEHCDCMNMHQDPLFKRNFGFLVGKNPFAIDRIAGEWIGEELKAAGKSMKESHLDAADRAAAYVHEHYGILPETPLEIIKVE